MSSTSDAGPRHLYADAHIHLFAQGFLGELGIEPAGQDELAVYEAHRARHRIQRALVIAYEGQQRYRGNNRHVASLAAVHEWVVPVAYLPTWPPPSSEGLKELRDQGFLGIALWVATSEDAAQLAGWPPAALAAINDDFTLVSLNAASQHIAQIREVVRDLASVTVLFSHLGLPGPHRGPVSPGAARSRLSGLLQLAEHDHVGVKASGYYAAQLPAHAYPHLSAQPFAEVLLDAFGPQRIYWGSDFPPALDHISFEQTVDIQLPWGLSDVETAAVRGGNLLRLVDTAHPAP